MNKAICDECKKEVQYNEQEDLKTNELIQLKMRKYLIDDLDNVVLHSTIPADKRRILNPKYVKLVCHECMLKRIHPKQ